MGKTIIKYSLIAVVSVGVLLCGFGVAHYYIYSLPNLKQEEINSKQAADLLERIDAKKEKCQKLGSEESVLESEKYNASSKAYPLTPAFHYSLKLDGCFYMGGVIHYTTGLSSYTDHFVKDLDSNRVVVSYSSTDAVVEDMENKDYNDFIDRAFVYMRD